MLTWLLPTRNEQSFKFFYYFEENSAATEQNWKILPSDVPREVTRVLAWTLWKGNGPAIPSLRAQSMEESACIWKQSCGIQLTGYNSSSI